MSVTLLQLKTRAKQRADMEFSEFVGDDELRDYINASIAELHDLLVSAYGSDYFVSDHTFNTVASTADYALPADFYKLIGIDHKVGSTEFTALKPFNFNERNKIADGRTPMRYRLVGSNLRLSPVPSGNTEIQVYYVPKATELVDDTDTLNDLNQFSEYVIVDAAIKMLQKQEDDVSVLMAQKAELKRRIEIMAENRDAGEAESISDVYYDDDTYRRFE